MRFRKSVPFGSAALLLVLAGIGIPATGVAAPDKFRIVCEEIGDAKSNEQPEYECWMKTGFFFPDGPKKPECPDESNTPQCPKGETFPRDRDFKINMNTMFVEEEGTDELKPLACPGWFFINGKWRYFTTGCPTIQIMDSGGEGAP